MPLHFLRRLLALSFCVLSTAHAAAVADAPVWRAQLQEFAYPAPVQHFLFALYMHDSEPFHPALLPGSTHLPAPD